MKPTWAEYMMQPGRGANGVYTVISTLSIHRSSFRSTYCLIRQMNLPCFGHLLRLDTITAPFAGAAQNVAAASKLYFIPAFLSSFPHFQFTLSTCAYFFHLFLLDRPINTAVTPRKSSPPNHERAYEFSAASKSGGETDVECKVHSQQDGSAAGSSSGHAAARDGNFSVD